MKRHKFVSRLILVLIVGVLSFGFFGNKQGSTVQKTVAVEKTSSTTASSGKVGASFLFNINNFVLPMNNQGILAEVTINNGSRNVTLGEFQGKGVLFAGGFMMSGYLVDTVTKAKTVFANAVAPASRIQDYSPGRWNADPSDDPQLYVVTRKDPDFGQSWKDWADAVKMGASFYDGDGDGVYNPVDKNGNGKWDANEDRPDFIGDQAVWCVFTDKIVGSQRDWKDQVPVGIDIQRTVFGFQSAGLLGNMLFVRYRIINRNAASPVMDSVFFSIWADPDIGNSADDLCGCDTVRNGGFAYNFGADNIWGTNPPCFFTTFFQGPIVSIPGETFIDKDGNGVFNAGDTPIDTAVSILGPLMGAQKIPGSKNLGIHSFVNYIQSDPNRGDPATGFQAMNYTRGLLKDGSALNPCTDNFGSVLGLACTNVNPRYWYSGNVQTNTGWMYTTPSDIRIMQNIGPFTLYKDQPVDVVVAYVVGRGSDAKSSVKEAQKISDFAQFLYNRNFAAPAPPQDVTPIIRTTENSIDLIWNTAPQVTYHALQYTDPPFNTVKAWDMNFVGYQVWMYRTNSTSDIEGGIQNSTLLAKYDLADKMDDILSENALTGERTIIYQKGTQLDSNVYKDPVKGRLALQITTDPFTNGPLIKGKPYYFAITAYALDNPGLQPVDSTKVPGNYLLTSKSAVGGTGTFPIIFNGGIRPGIDFNDPYVINQSITPTTGNIGTGLTLSYDEINKDSLKGNQYRVNFFKKSDSTLYFMYWRLTNTTMNTVLLDSQRAYNAPKDSVAQKTPEGMLIHVGKTDPAIGSVTYTGKSYTSSPYYVKNSTHTQWYKSISADAVNSGAFYTGTDQTVSQGNGALPPNKSAFIKADRLRKMEIRFGATQKAYRYIKGTVGGWVYAAKNSLPGFVDVPFQVWVKDDRYGEQRQLACAFLETTTRGGNADGVWNPGFSLDSTKEYIVIFDRLYTPDSLVVYTGGTPTGTSPVWANISLGWTRPDSWPSSYLSSADSTIAKNAWFDAVYIVGLARDTAFNFSTGQVDTLKWQNGDVVTINVANYPILPTDSFVFTTHKKGEGLSATDKVASFDRVTVYPNPLFAYNSLASYDRTNSDNSFVTFSNLPIDVTIKIFSISGSLIRVLSTTDKTLGPTSPFLNWNLLNQSGLRVASGMYIAVVSSPGLGEKVLKFGIIMPQKQIGQY